MVVREAAASMAVVHVSLLVLAIVCTVLYSTTWSRLIATLYSPQFTVV